MASTARATAKDAAPPLRRSLPGTVEFVGPTPRRQPDPDPPPSFSVIIVAPFRAEFASHFDCSADPIPPTSVINQLLLLSIVVL
jgi:hypothetical protein